MARKKITIDKDGNLGEVIAHVHKQAEGGAFWQATPPKEWWIRFNGSPFANEITTDPRTGKSPEMLLAAGVDPDPTPILYTVSPPGARTRARAVRIHSAGGIIVDA